MAEIKEILLDKTYHETIKLMLDDSPLELAEKLVTNDVMGFGTTIDETIFGINGLRKLIKDQRAQGADIDIKYDTSILYQRLSADGNQAVIANEMKISMQMESGIHEINVRGSLIFEFLKNKWKMVHWHGSTAVDSEGDTWHKEEWKQQNEKLKKQVEEKTADLLQKNRELEIETSLERIRTIAMSMQKAEGLLEVVEILYKELKTLGFTNIRNTIINIFNDTKEIFLNYDYSDYGVGGISEVDYNSHPSNKELVNKMREASNEFMITEFTGNELDEWRKWRIDQGQMPDSKLDQAESLYYYEYSIGVGTIGISTFSPINADQLKILNKIRNVFDLAYRRYADIEQAEAYAREAKIEAALERVRSRSMAMHNSEELSETAMVMFEQLCSLGQVPDRLGIVIYNEQQQIFENWITDQSGMQLTKAFKSSIEESTTFAKIYKAWKEKKDSIVIDLSGEELKSWLQFIKGNMKMFINESNIKNRRIHYAAFFSHGSLMCTFHEPVADNFIQLLVRFAKVFDQTYTRFLDLQNAEAQTREAQIETALERVRARALAMQQPEELKEVAQVLRQEMGLIGVEELETSSIFINDESTHKAECWYAIKDVRDDGKTLVNDHFPIDLNDTWVGREMLKFYQADEEQVSIAMTGKPRIEWIRYCEKMSVPFRGYYGEVIPDRTYHLCKFSHGTIGAATPGDFSNESWTLLKRAASVFSLAYSRFKDLRNARYDLLQLKEEKKRAEIALTELKSTQTQLIHAEKMASLGELTAGIAHEIQNPLNFVNNFSEVSVDLMEEMAEEMTEGNTEEVKEIAGDLKQNLEKIHHHGNRASFIVKGMLEHSRTSTGEKVPTDISVLADEYLRLAYHGLRARDKSFNAKFKTDFDKDLPKINVIPQDFGRVLLNLINNAFYAVAEKQKKHPVDYQPLVTIRTSKKEDMVEIKVSDNGNGIPANVGDKIFQPFFTTKPSGEGTGLGLSLSYDIITKGHKGRLRVDTNEGEGTEFIIVIPEK